MNILFQAVEFIATQVIGKSSIVGSVLQDIDI